MKKIYRNIGFVVAMAIMAASVVFPSPARSTKKNSAKVKWEDGADARKADYYFMEALRQNTQDSDDAFFDLMQGAWALDSTDTDAGITLGYYMMALGQRDTTYASRGYRMMRRHFTENPSDYYGAIFYGMINDRLGNTAESVRVWQTLDSLNPDNSDVALKYAEALTNRRDSLSLRKSIEVMRRIERAEGADLGLTSHTVRSLMELGDTTAVFAELERFRKASPRNSNFYIYAGDVNTVLQRPDSAIACYDYACAVDSANGLAYYKRAEFFKDRGDSVAFDREVFKALGMESLDVEVKLEMLGSYVRQLYTDSLQRPRIQHLFDVIINQNPHEPRIRDLYSSYLVAVQDFAGAAEQQEVALDADPSDVHRWQGVMSLWYSAKNYGRSNDVGERALRYFPDDPGISLMIGGNYEMLDKWEEALPFFRRSLENCDSSAFEQRSQAMAAIGDVYHHIGKTDSAFVWYEQAIRTNPDNVMALNNFAYYLAEENRDLDRAEQLSELCVAAQPDNDTFLDTYAWIFFKKHDYARAKEYIDQAIDLEADDPQADVFHHAGDIYYMSGEPQEALELWEEALKLDPDNALLQKKVRNRTHYYE